MDGFNLLPEEYRTQRGARFVPISMLVTLVGRVGTPDPRVWFIVGACAYGATCGGGGQAPQA